MSLKRYPSHISKEQFSFIEPILISDVKVTCPRKADLHVVFNAILYILKSGCQWSMLPRDFPPKSTVHYYFQQWKSINKDGVSKFDLALKKMCEQSKKYGW